MAENNLHAYRTGLKKHHKCWEGKFGYHHNKSKEVIEFDLKGNELNRYGSIREAAKNTNISISAIQQRCTWKKDSPIKDRFFKYAL